MDDERELIVRAQGGDDDAFVALLGRHDRQIMSVVYRFTCDLYDREDLYQEVFLHCFRSIAKYRFKAAFRTWLYRLALNRCVTYMKRRPVHEPVDDDAVGDDAVGGDAVGGDAQAAPVVDWERRLKLRAVRSALARLRGPQQLSFHLFYIEGWGVPEIAEVLECSEGTVKSHLNRARVKIKADDEVLVWRTNP